MPKVPWDLAVFLTITTVGFGYSVQRMAHRETQSNVRFGRALKEAETSLDVAGVGRQSIDLGCLEQRSTHQHIMSDQGSIRLRGKFCRFTHRDMKQFEGVRVKNLTNGFEGTIFFHGYDATFVTDSVTLEPGRNLIQLEWRANASSPARVYTAEVVQR
jgi:hypothetical protein